MWIVSVLNPIPNSIIYLMPLSHPTWSLEENTQFAVHSCYCELNTGNPTRGMWSADTSQAQKGCFRHFWAPQKKKLHWHPRRPPKALCCLTLSGDRCLCADKDGLFSTCSTVISFKVSIRDEKHWQLVQVGGAHVPLHFETAEGVMCRADVVWGQCWWKQWPYKVRL